MIRSGLRVLVAIPILRPGLERINVGQPASASKNDFHDSGCSKVGKHIFYYSVINNFVLSKSDKAFTGIMSGVYQQPS